MSGKKAIFIAGFGGQGVLLIGQMLSYAALFDDKEVTWMPAYGPEMRGGTANCTVVISDTAISSPLVTECDVLIAMNGASLAKFEDMLVPGGELFVNTGLCPEPPKRKDINIHYVDCTNIAEEKLGNTKVANMVMLGAVNQITKITTLETMFKVFEYTLKGPKAKLIPLNMRAMEAWSE